MDLNGFISHLLGDLTAIQFAHGGLFSEGALILTQPAGLVQKVSRQFDLQFHIRQLEGNGLLLANGTPELDTFLGIAQGSLVGPLGTTETHGPNGKTPAVEGRKHLLEPIPWIPKNGITRDTAIV